MKKIVFALMLLCSVATTFAASNGVITTASKFSSNETLDRLEGILKSKGLTIFAKINHAEEARKVDLIMRPSQLIVFGNPKSGTPIMQAVPEAAIDLPLKALVWEDADGKVWLSYNEPAWLQNRFKLDDDALKSLKGVPSLMEAATK